MKANGTFWGFLFSCAKIRRSLCYSWCRMFLSSDDWLSADFSCSDWIYCNLAWIEILLSTVSSWTLSTSALVENAEDFTIVSSRLDCFWFFRSKENKSSREIIFGKWWDVHFLAILKQSKNKLLFSFRTKDYVWVYKNGGCNLFTFNKNVGLINIWKIFRWSCMKLLENRKCSTHFLSML